MNILDSKISEVNSSSLKLQTLDQEVEIDFGASLNVNKDEKYFLGIRPRSFEIVDNNSANTFSGQVDLIENMGAEVLIHVKVKESTFRSVQSRSDNINIGDSINLQPKKGQVHLFNKDGKVIRNE